MLTKRAQSLCEENYAYTSLGNPLRILKLMILSYKTVISQMTVKEKYFRNKHYSMLCKDYVIYLIIHELDVCKVMRVVNFNEVHKAYDVPLRTLQYLRL